MTSGSRRTSPLRFGLLVCCLLVGCDTSAPDQESPATRARSEPQVLIHSNINAPQSQDQTRAILDLPRIVAFGNSLTAGLGVAQDQAYPAILQRQLDQKGYQYRVVNAGVSGDTTAGGLRRLNWVLKNNPSIVILELGANDGLRGHPLTETFHNLESIIQGFQAAGVKVVLAGMQIPPNYGLPYTTQFSNMFSTLADKYHLTFMPFFLDGVAAHSELNQADGLHPTTEGYEIIVENLIPILETVLQKPN